MPYVRVTRDARGYETTLLLHSPRPGERPHVLYWYRSAPGIRVGRPAFDEDAIRLIEERYPEIEFDWPLLIEDASTSAPEEERRIDYAAERRRRKAARREAAESASAEKTAGEPVPRPAQREVPVLDTPGGLELPDLNLDEPAARAVERVAEVATPANPLLEQLVGREIAMTLRTRYAELVARIDQSAPDEATRTTWYARAAGLDPDRWSSPHDILHGVENADRLFDALRRELFVAD